MYDCDPILQRLSQYLDGNLPETELAALRHKARALPGCEAMLDAMLWAHQALATAPMVETSRDFSVSVTRELAWRQRRDKIMLGGVLALAVLTMLAPLLLIAWAGLAALLEPGILQAALGWLLGAISEIAAFGVAVTTVVSHAPQWVFVAISTFFSLSLLLLALATVMQKAPEQLFSTAKAHSQSA